MIKTLAATAAAAALLATGAHAATYTFDFGFTSQGGEPFEVAIGTLTTSDTLNADGAYDVTGITGNVSQPGANGFPMFETITGLSNYFGADNELYPTDPRVDNDGISFTSSAGGYFNLFTSAVTGGATVYYSPTGSTSDFTRSYVTLAVTQVPTSAAPEPGTWALMMAGVGLAGAALRRRRTATLAAA